MIRRIRWRWWRGGHLISGVTVRGGMLQRITVIKRIFTIWGFIMHNSCNFWPKEQDPCSCLKGAQTAVWKTLKCQHCKTARGNLFSLTSGVLLLNYVNHSIQPPSLVISIVHVSRKLIYSHSEIDKSLLCKEVKRCLGKPAHKSGQGFCQ